MTNTTIISLNAALDLLAVAAVFAVVRLTHRLHQHEVPETLHPSQPIPLHLALPADEAEELARAA